MDAFTRIRGSRGKHSAMARSALILLFAALAPLASAPWASAEQQDQVPALTCQLLGSQIVQDYHAPPPNPGGMAPDQLHDSWDAYGQWNAGVLLEVQIQAPDGWQILSVIADSGCTAKTDTGEDLAKLRPVAGFLQLLRSERQPWSQAQATDDPRGMIFSLRFALPQKPASALARTAIALHCILAKLGAASWVSVPLPIGAHAGVPGIPGMAFQQSTPGDVMLTFSAQDLATVSRLVLADAQGQELQSGSTRYSPENGQRSVEFTVPRQVSCAKVLILPHPIAVQAAFGYQDLPLLTAVPAALLRPCPATSEAGEPMPAGQGPAPAQAGAPGKGAPGKTTF